MSLPWASYADIAQIIKAGMSYLRGPAKVTDAPAEVKKPEVDVPANTLTAAFTTVDEAVYCGNLKGLLAPENEGAIDLLEAQMKPHQVEQFRLMVLNMVNPDVSANRMEPILDKAGKPTGAKKSVPYTVNHAFTAKDSRVLRLQSYAGKILTPVAKKNATGAILMQAPTPARKKKVAEAIVTKLLKEGSITEKSVSDITKEKFDSGKQAVSDSLYHGVAFAQLGREYGNIRSNFVLTEASKEQMVSAAFNAKLVAKQAELDRLGFKGVLTNKWAYAFVIPVGMGIIYILFL